MLNFFNIITILLIENEKVTLFATIIESKKVTLLNIKSNNLNDHSLIIYIRRIVELWEQNF